MSSEAALNDSYSSRLRPIDVATLAYILIEVLIILVFMSGRPGWLYMLFFYISAAIIVLLMTAFPFDEFSGPGKMVRILYPVVLILFFSRAMGTQLFIIFDKPFDTIIHQIELGVFGIDPAFAVQKYIDVWLNEVMSFGYSIYYLFLPSALILFLLSRKWNSLEKMVLAGAIAYYLCFLISVFFPVVGPRFFLDDIYYLPVVGPFFTPVASAIVNLGSHYGASMPSSQCAVALIAAWSIGRDFKKLKIPVIFITLLICLSTVYGRFHYLTESLAGVIIGILGLWISNRWQNRFMKRKENGSAITGDN